MKILIPSGDYPALKKGNLRNIEETAGVPVEIVFLTGEQRYGIHLELLDKAFYEIDDEWVFVQHPDLFWQGHGWMKEVQRAIKANPDMAAIMFSKKNYIGSFKYHNYKFGINGFPMVRTHDFLGCYNRRRFVEKKLSFQWGLYKNLLCSEELRKQQIWYYPLNRRLRDDDRLDGADLIGLELAMSPGSVGEIVLKSAAFDHAWGVFVNSSFIRQEGTELLIDRPYESCLRGLLTLAWLTTHLEDMGDVILPYEVIKQIMPGQPNKIVHLMNKYIPRARKKIPKITKVTFLDCSFNIIPHI